MAIKGQKFNSYSDEVKKEAIRLHVEEKWTYRKITEHFQIQDSGRVKKWMKKYRELGEFGLLDQRGRRKEYIDQDRYVQKLKRENEMLKKCLEIWMQEVKRTNIESLRAPQKNMPLETYVNSLGSPEVDTTLSRSAKEQIGIRKQRRSFKRCMNDITESTVIAKFNYSFYKTTGFG